MKAQFHKSQRVFVKPVGTWALIEQVVPYWVKDCEEPLKVTYEVGLGREFKAAELVSEQDMHARDRSADEEDVTLELWRVERIQNRSQAPSAAMHHPHPGTFPAVLTDESEWGGWRVPVAEYDRDPQRIEHQARMIVNSPDLMKVARKFAEFATDNPNDVPPALMPVAKRCVSILQYVYELDGELPEIVAAE